MYTDEQEQNLLEIEHQAECFKGVWEDALDSGDAKLRDMAYTIYKNYCDLYENLGAYYYNMNRH